MTTNNHPANGPVSLDRLHQIREILSKAAAQSDGGNLGYAMADAVKVIDEVMSIPEKLPCPVHLEPGLKFGKGVPTSLVLGALRRRADYYAELETMTPEQRAEHDAGIAEFKAMLGSAHGKSDDEIGSWNNHVNTPTAQAGNSPATPDTWIPVSERMPNDKDFVWCWGYVSGWTESDGFEAYYDATRNKWWTVDDETVRKVTHWMELPAAPQQEVKAALKHGMQRYAGAMQKLSEGDK
ncbi:DUF551 domain-containing protein [Citrobacter sp. Cb004]|uniref:DUF551 domain-containing protein n=1 Tax=Citrobacter sp. Cb004 TaxID=2985006 RepID=UPI0025786D86|nr:DUF551 domain-containing protein [Citrobacter sp. Cb004]MDM3358750.1 DUF551 domain-containing protein [Citrobacter sp. Cb004]